MTKTTQQGTTTSKEYTILIVDDNPANLSLLTDYLKDYKFRILVARSGKSALKKLEHIRPHIILLDVMMPDMDGFETCQALKNNEATREMPVIFMTALSDPADKVRGFQVGANDYITKPLQHEEVLARINLHLSLWEMANNLQNQNRDLQRVKDELQQANEDLSKRTMQLETSRQLGQQITAILSINELLPQVTELIRTNFEYDFVGLWLTDWEHNVVILKAGAGLDNGYSPPLNTELSEYDSRNPVVQAWRTGQHYVTTEADDSVQQLTVPLVFGPEQIGVLDIRTHSKLAFEPEDEAVIQLLADQLAIAIRNAQRYEAQEEKYRSLTKLNADKDTFFSIISHDLRGPFQAVVGYSELLQLKIDRDNKEELKMLGQKLHRSAKSTYHLFENILHWSRLQRGRIPYEPQTLELIELVEGTISLLHSNAQEKGIDLSSDIDEEILIYADQNMIDTVIRNLTSNAIKFTPQGGQVFISAHIKPQDSFTSPSGNNATSKSVTQREKAKTPSAVYRLSKRIVEVMVTDTGVGIAPDEMQNLFRLDKHHSTSGTANEEGTGLGLILCKEMVESNGGRIWLDSEKGKGTTVTFTVPGA